MLGNLCGWSCMRAGLAIGRPCLRSRQVHALRRRGRHGDYRTPRPPFREGGGATLGSPHLMFSDVFHDDHLRICLDCRSRRTYTVLYA